MTVETSDTTITRTTVCPHDCPDTCGIAATVAAGRLVRVRGLPGHPITGAALCTRVSRYQERVYSPNRILYPMRRVAPKGESGPAAFRRIAWDDAVEEIAGRFQHLIDTVGAESILPYSFMGTEGIVNAASMDRRFFHRLGASQLLRSVCAHGARAGLESIYGSAAGADPETIPEARLIVAWAGDIFASNMHMVPLIRAARRNGARYVHVNCHRNPLAGGADLFIQPRPGTDAALALAVIHLLIERKLYDEEFVREHTVGFEALRQRAEAYRPARAAAITDVPVAQIEELAELYGTCRPSLTRIGLGAQRHTNGGITTRAIGVIPALVGSVGVPGGGFICTNLDHHAFNRKALERPDLMPAPEPRTVNMNQLADWLTAPPTAPPIGALYVYNSNPAATAPDQRRVIAGMTRPDVFITAHEQVWTDTCAYADIVLPATTAMEHLDLYPSWWHLYVQLGEPVIAPCGESKCNADVFRLLARAMGFDDPCFRDTDEDLIRQALASQHPHLTGITLERLRAEKHVKLNAPRPFVPYADHVFPTPSGKVEFYSRTLADRGLDPLSDYVPEVEGPDGSPALAARYPLSLLSISVPYFLNTSFGGVQRLVTKAGGAALLIHPRDAAERGIETGDLLRMWNDRGECLLFTVVTAETRPGVVLTARILRNATCPGGRNHNQTTSSRVTDIGGGSTFYTNLVQVERASAGGVARRATRG